MLKSTEVPVNPIRTDIGRLDSLNAGQLAPAQPAASQGPEAFSDFASFAGQGSVRLGLSGASVDPIHAARTVVSFIAEA